MNNAEYWKKRTKLSEDAIKDRVFDKYVKNIRKSYDEAIRDIDTKITAWYQRFAENNELSFADAQKLLKSDELREFKWSVEDYIRYATENDVSAERLKELENASARVHISRLESLEFELRTHAERLTDTVIKNTDEAAKQAYTQSYEHTAYEFQRGIGVGFSFQHIDEKRLEKLLDKPWTADGQTFKAKCWTDKSKLVEAVGRELTRMAATGEGPRKAFENISRLFDTSKKNASRLIMTESAYFSSLAQKDSYEELDVEEYENVGTFDKLMCDLCGDMNGKVFPMSKFEPGTTAPPFHPWCRCTTVPHFADMKGVGERYARDIETGKGYFVPSDMTFGEWKAEQAKLVDERKKTEYNKFKDDVFEQLKEYSKKMNNGSQTKHIRGSHNFDETRSELTVDPQMLYDLYFEESIPIRLNNGAWPKKNRFTHTSNIGIYRNKNAGIQVPTNKGLIHFSLKKGWHIVPSNPKGD